MDIGLLICVGIMITILFVRRVGLIFAPISQLDPARGFFFGRCAAALLFDMRKGCAFWSLSRPPKNINR